MTADPLITPCWSNPPPDPLVIPRIARVLIARIIKVYGDAGVSLPDRHEWVLGNTAYDCEKLIVALTGLSEGLVQGEGAQSPCDVTITATFQVTVVRCAPVADDRGVMPLPDKIAVMTDRSAVDAYLLMVSACKFDMWGAGMEPPLHPSALGGMGVNASIEIGESQGGMQGVVLNLTTVIA